MFDDTPVANRVYAYLANVEISKFNELEMEVLKRLGYNSLIEEGYYYDYMNELDSFWKKKEEVLNKWYTDYVQDKLILKEIKQTIFNQQLNSKINRRHEGININYSDAELSERIQNAMSNENNSRIIESSDKYRFESYNSHDFKEQHIKKRVGRCKSV